MPENKTYPVVALGCSAGGLAAVSYLLEKLPAGFTLPFIIVQHRSRNNDQLLEKTLQTKSHIKIKQADEKEPVRRGNIYIAPPDYHLLLENDETFSLSREMEVHYSRPSIDALFETAAETYGPRLTGILLTGASSDGAAGISAIRHYGGITIAQDPQEAPYPIMPRSAIDTGAVQYVLKLEDIANYLTRLDHEHRDT